MAGISTSTMVAALGGMFTGAMRPVNRICVGMTRCMGGGVSGPLQAGGTPVVSVSAPVDGERVSTRLGNYRVTGTVRDPIAGPKAIDRVQVWLNGERNTEQASYIGDADIAP